MSPGDIVFYVSLGMIVLGLSPFLFAGVLYLIEDRLGPAAQVLREHRAARQIERAEAGAGADVDGGGEDGESVDLVEDATLDHPQRGPEAGVVARVIDLAPLDDVLVGIDDTENRVQSDR